MPIKGFAHSLDSLTLHGRSAIATLHRPCQTRRSHQGRIITCQSDRKTALVTGSNTGLGLETAKALAAQGYMTVVACRDANKAAATKAKILEAVPGAKVEGQAIDLSNLSSIRNFAERALSFPGHSLDVLVNNAGVMAPPLMRTKDGFELQIGVNHLGHFLLTQMLMPLLTTDRPSRIINVSSSAHMFGTIDLQDLNYNSRSYSAWPAYGQSKLANILYSYELARRIKPSDNLTVNALHPGVVATELQRYLLPEKPAFWQKPLIAVVEKFIKSPAEGAKTHIYLATSDEVANVSGKYYVDCKPTTSNKESYDPDVAKRLWDLSAELVNLKD